MAGVKPLGPRVLVDRDEPDEKTKGGIYVPENARELPLEGTVIAVGEGRIALETGDRIPPQVSKDDRVLFGKYVGTEVEVEGKTYVMMHEDEILGVLT